MPLRVRRVKPAKASSMRRILLHTKFICLLPSGATQVGILLGRRADQDRCRERRSTSEGPGSSYWQAWGKRSAGRRVHEGACT